MVQQVEKVVELDTTLEVKPDYDLHIKVQAEVRSVLRDSAGLAYKMGDIPKSDLVDLFSHHCFTQLCLMLKTWLSLN